MAPTVRLLERGCTVSAPRSAAIEDDETTKWRRLALPDLLGCAEEVDLGGLARVWIMEAPRRPGAVYGEAYHADAAHRIAEAVRRDPQEAADLAQQLRIPE